PVAPPPPQFAPPQVAPPPVAPPPAGPPGAGTPGAPPAGEKPSGEKPEDEVKDGWRLRGGFSVNGGVMLLPNDAGSVGPSFGFAGRLGVQINHYFGIVYQNTPIVTFTLQQSGTSILGGSSAGYKAGFADYNSLLLMLTLFHHLDIGAGPS